MARGASPGSRRRGGLWLPALLLAGLWWLLADGDPGSWVVGLPVLALAVWAAARLDSAALLGGVSWSGLAAFIPYFLGAAVRGGADVAWRAVRRHPDLAPGYLEHRSDLGEGAPLGFFVGVVSLLPGTLGVAITGAGVRIHVLDLRMANAEELTRLEGLVARVFPEARRHA